MATLQYQCTMSLDGFIAGPGGDMGWLNRFSAPNPVVARLREGTGSILVGRHTFGGDDPNRGTENEGEAYGGGWSGEQFVLTHRIPKQSVPGVTFLSGLEEAVAAAKAAAGGKWVGVLGAHVAAQCIEAGLLDEVYVVVAPILLGGGVRLFDRPQGPYVDLERIEAEVAANEVNARFRVVKHDAREE